MKLNSKKGFTIIEVVLVLAIAGLIFLMVFIALPAMQRNQHDTQRRNDYSALSAAITNYATNNGGKLPGECSVGNVSSGSYSLATTRSGICSDTTKYINSSSDSTIGNGTLALDPSGNPYILKVIKAASIVEITEAATTASGSLVYVVLGADCSGSGSLGNKPAATTGTRNFAVYGALETGTYCAASS